MDCTSGTLSEITQHMSEQKKQWCLYLIECRNGALYAGITNNLAARYAAHVAGKGARYTRANPPVRLVGSCEYADRSSASRGECAIRKLPAASKAAFLDKLRSGEISTSA